MSSFLPQLSTPKSAVLPTKVETLLQYRTLSSLYPSLLHILFHSPSLLHILFPSPSLLSPLFSLHSIFKPHPLSTISRTLITKDAKALPSVTALPGITSSRPSSKAGPRPPSRTSSVPTGDPGRLKRRSHNRPTSHLSALDQVTPYSYYTHTRLLLYQQCDNAELNPND
jgi:hypothetical protein